MTHKFKPAEFMVTELFHEKKKKKKKKLERYTQDSNFPCNIERFYIPATCLLARSDL